MASSDVIRLKIQNYVDQRDTWPKAGRHILAQFDEDNIVLYQAFSPQIAKYAVDNGKFGGPSYSFDRMTWVKTNFLWMMYRAGWATKPNQERILAIHITREGFEEILRASAEAKAAKGKQPSATGVSSEYFVRLQWDPDHDPNGEKHMTRRAIQLGLKGNIVREFNEKWIQNIQDITDFVTQQHEFVKSGRVQELMTPCERVFIPSDEAICRHIRLDSHTVSNNEQNNEDDTQLKSEAAASETSHSAAAVYKQCDYADESAGAVGSDIGTMAISKEKVILCLGGAFNPVHTQHVMTMVLGKRWLEDTMGVDVVAGRLAVAPDGYAKSKTSRSNQKCMKVNHRIRLCELACEDYSSWLGPYPKHCGSALECGEKTKQDLLEDSKELGYIQVAVIVGADRAVNKSGHAKWHKKNKHLTVCIGRKGETTRVTDLYTQDDRDGKVRSQFLMVPDELENISSTAVRRVLSALDDVDTDDEKREVVDRLVKDGWICRKVGEYILENESDLYLT